MKIAFITNLRAPYRKLQFEELSKIKNVSFNVYYTDKNFIGRKWNVDNIEGVQEFYLKGIKLFKKYGYINTGLIKVIKKNDLIILGGYEQPTYIILSVLCSIFKKPYSILYDGISPHKIYLKENLFKYKLKKVVISKARTIFGNGEISKLYFTEKFKFDKNKIYNQYLTVDVETILKLSQDAFRYRQKIREKYNIAEDKKVIIYSGRLIKLKRVKDIIEAITKTNKETVLLVIGDGDERENILGLSNNICRVIVTGFISQQKELFKNYFAGDCLVLASDNEVWGLVINEAMAAGLPVIVSDECGAVLDLVKHGVNGYSFKVGNVEELSEAIDKIFSGENYIQFGKKSKEIITKWTFKHSRESFEKMLNENFIV